MLQNITQQSKRILVAEDDPVIRHLVTSLVTKEGYTVIPANDGNEAQFQAILQMIIGQRQPSSLHFAQKLSTGQHRHIGI